MKASACLISLPIPWLRSVWWLTSDAFALTTKVSWFVTGWLLQWFSLAIILIKNSNLWRIKTISLQFLWNRTSANTDNERQRTLSNLYEESKEEARRKGRAWDEMPTSNCIQTRHIRQLTWRPFNWGFGRESKTSHTTDASPEAHQESEHNHPRHSWQPNGICREAKLS